MVKNNIKSYAILHFSLLLYALSTIIMKFAALKPAFSLMFFLLYGLALLVLMIYAFLWQKVLNKLSLTVAFANKGIVLIYGFLSGALIFGETISLKSIIAGIIVLLGIYMVISDEN